MDGFFQPSNLDISVPGATPPLREDEVELQLALTDLTRTHAYKIRHEGYLSYNFIVGDSSGLFVDAYDGRPNVRTVVAYRDNQPAATVRVCLFDPSGEFPGADKLPAMEIFDSEIRALTANVEAGRKPKRAVEVGRLARAPEFANDKKLIHALFRAVGYLVLYFKADIVLNACRPHHMPMYRRFGFQNVQEPRLYPGLTFEAGLMACERSSYGSACEKLPFLRRISPLDDAYQSLICGERTTFSDPTKPGLDFSLMASSLVSRPAAALVS
jgi:hypothetical protein